MRRLPLFPLPVVLFPGTSMPLHIFEPRYRQMVARCLEGDRRFGLVYHDPDREGPFTVEGGGVGCVAEIVQFQPLPDGRSLVLVRGGERFRLEDGIESEALYHEGLVDEYPDEPEEGGGLAAPRERAVALFGRVLEKVTSTAPAPLPLDEESPVSFQLAQWVRTDARWKQALLEMRRESERLESIVHLLRLALEE